MCKLTKNVLASLIYTYIYIYKAQQHGFFVLLLRFYESVDSLVTSLNLPESLRFLATTTTSLVSYRCLLCTATFVPSRNFSIPPESVSKVFTISSGVRKLGHLRPAKDSQLPKSNALASEDFVHIETPADESLFEGIIRVDEPNDDDIDFVTVMTTFGLPPYVANRLQVFPGSEFRVAYEQAMKYGGRVTLGDRPAEVKNICPCSSSQCFIPLRGPSRGNTFVKRTYFVGPMLLSFFFLFIN